MCSACVNDLVDRCCDRVGTMQSEIARLVFLLRNQAIKVSDPASNSHEKDFG
jgi:hypothetical protein